MTRVELILRTRQLIAEGERLDAAPSLTALQTWLQLSDDLLATAWGSMDRYHLAWLMVGKPKGIVRGRPMTPDEEAAYVREVAGQKTAALRMSLDAVERQGMPFRGETGGFGAGQGMGEVPSAPAARGRRGPGRRRTGTRPPSRARPTRPLPSATPTSPGLAPLDPPGPGAPGPPGRGTPCRRRPHATRRAPRAAPGAPPALTGATRGYRDPQGRHAGRGRHAQQRHEPVPLRDVGQRPQHAALDQRVHPVEQDRRHDRPAAEERRDAHARAGLRDRRPPGPDQRERDDPADERGDGQQPGPEVQQPEQEERQRPGVRHEEATG